MNILLRPLLRLLPLVVLVRRIIENIADGEFCFVEDAHLAPASREALQQRNILLEQPHGFFRTDRIAVRAGVIFRKATDKFAPLLSGISDTGETTQLHNIEDQLNHWLRSAGRKENRYCLIPCSDPDSPFHFPYQIAGFQNNFSDLRPQFILLWIADRPPLESLLGAEIAAKIPEPPEKAQPAVLPNETKALVAINKIPAFPPVTAPVVALAKQVPSFERKPQVASGAPAMRWKHWRALQFGVIAGGRGRFFSKFCLRQEAKTIRASMLMSHKRISPEYSLNFFDNVQYAPDSIQTHQQLLRAAAPREIYSFSIEVDENSVLRSIVYGIRPILWRAEKKRFRLFPMAGFSKTDNSPESMHVIRYAMGPGDRLVVVPGGFQEDEAVSLREIFMISDSNEFAARLSGWLAARGYGRGFAILRPGEPD